VVVVEGGGRAGLVAHNGHLVALSPYVCKRDGWVGRWLSCVVYVCFLFFSIQRRFLWCVSFLDPYVCVCGVSLALSYKLVVLRSGEGE